ncbi:putative transcription factor homeobox-WOX family [Helianthus annuus]|nr:putative transcription factor homeobox-WOX family [Helianthus annuus]
MESSRLFFGSTSSNNMFFLGNGDNYFRGTRVGEEFSKKRPFFSSLDDMLEEEYYDEQLTEKKRRLSTEQVRMLERSFEEENKLEPERKTELAKKLGLQPRQVAVWFQNRRARWKTKTLERDYDRLKSSFDILTSDFDSIVKENEKLKAEVLSLTGKLQSKEVLETSTVGGSAAVEAEYVLAPPRPVKVEDRFSTGSGGSAVVDDQDGPQLVDSGDSYFPDDDYPHEYAAVPVDQSEEDDGSDNGHNDFPYPFATTDHQHHEEADVLGWWSVVRDYFVPAARVPKITMICEDTYPETDLPPRERTKA